MDIAVLIPAYNPGQALVEYVNKLDSYGFSHILIVDDGSESSYKKMFEQCEQYTACIVISHTTRHGRGQALKAGLSYYKKHCHDCLGVVIGEFCGKYAASDTIKVAAMLEQYEDTLILSRRRLYCPEISKPKRISHRLFSLLLRMLYGLKLKDARSAIRGIPNSMMSWLCELEGTNFEYETNMLIECRTRKLPILEISIQEPAVTQYGSYPYSPIRDGFKVYWLLTSKLIGYIFNGVGSYFVDIGLYTILVKSRIFDKLHSSVLIATAIARIISSLVNYLLNKQLVFKVRGSFFTTLTKYIISVVVVLLCSASFVTLCGLIFSLDASETVLIKLCVDTLLSFVSYKLQRWWVFPEAGSHERSNFHWTRSFKK